MIGPDPALDTQRVGPLALSSRRAFLLATLSGLLLAGSQMQLNALAWVALAPLTLAASAIH